MVFGLAWALVAAALGIRVVIRLLQGLRATTIAPLSTGTTSAIAVILPVLNEAERVEPCLRGLLANAADLVDILVVDGGSTDATIECVRSIAGHDPRVRIIDAAPIPSGWNGKAWGLECGLRAARPDVAWIATIDADVRPSPGLFAAMVAHAERRGVRALSVATQQEVATLAMAIVHPAMLATLIYRFGAPGREARRIRDVQANGQCFLAERSLLLDRDVFAGARTSRCEDVTIARGLVAAGIAVGFYEAGSLVRVRMYESAAETWRNWPRSLTLRDRYAAFGGWPGIVEILLVQAAPLPVFVACVATGTATSLVGSIALALVCLRLGILGGSARAYATRPWTYWLAPLADLPVACALIAAMLRRSHSWRGRTLVPEVAG